MELRALDGLLQRSLELRSSVHVKFVNELLVAASEKAVAIVQPRDNETVNQSN